MKVRRAALGLAVAGTLILGTAAAAYFAGHAGSGRTSLRVAVPQHITLTSGAPVAELQPGGSAAVTFTAINPNAYPVVMKSIFLDTNQGTTNSGFSIDSSHPGCTIANAHLSFTSAVGNWTLPASSATVITASTTTGVASSATPTPTPAATTPPASAIPPLAMGVEANNACQGASITLYLKSTP